MFGDVRDPGGAGVYGFWREPKDGKRHPAHIKALAGRHVELHAQQQWDRLGREICCLEFQICNPVFPRDQREAEILFAQGDVFIGSVAGLPPLVGIMNGDALQGCVRLGFE